MGSSKTPYIMMVKAKVVEIRQMVEGLYIRPVIPEPKIAIFIPDI